MSIEIETTVILASVEVNDEYGVTLTQRHKRIFYSAEEAERLAGELMDRAAEARVMLAADGARETFSHGFDIEPVCRECSETKHGACNGRALIETGAEAALHDVRCFCAVSGHTLVGGGS